MLSRYEKLLIWRYLLPGAEGRIVVFVAAIGFAAVAIGVAALIVVMSVMNGARSKLAIQFASFDGHASISRPGKLLHDWRALEAHARGQAAVRSTVPALDAAAMATAQGRAFPVTIRGLPPAELKNASIFRRGEGILIGNIPRVDEGVVVGSDLATRLGVSIGSHVTIVRPAVDADGALSLKSIGYSVTGLLETGIPAADGRLIVMNMQAAQDMLGSGDAVSRINIALRNEEKADEALAPLKQKLGGTALLQTWRELNKPIFDALALEQIGMFIALSLVLLVALFNILSSLVMLVGSKVRDIAMMRTMGASRVSILKIFVAVGTIIGSGGATTGSILGLSLVSSKDALASMAKTYLLRDAYAKEISVLIDLPARISLGEVLAIAAMTLIGTALATLYPAYRAAQVDPALALRHS